MTDAERAARDLLARLGAAISGRDHAAAVALFDRGADVALVGSEAGEAGFGWPEVEAFLAHLFARPIAFGWEWARVHAGARGDVLWFVAEGDVVETRAGGVTRTPYRMSGAAAGDPPRLVFVHGSEPVPGK